jgi:hypothetical protein
MSARSSMTVLNAIELMTAWTARPDGPPDLLVASLHRQLDEAPVEFRLSAAVELIMGMTTLCGSLLTIYELGLGIAPEEMLRDLALHFGEI